MADLADVLDTLQTEIVSAVYPVTQTVGASVIGFDVEIGVGWPNDRELDRALSMQRAYVAIYPLDGERNVTQYEYTETAVDRDAPGISVAYNDDTTTAVFTGIVTQNDVVGVVYDRKAYYYLPIVGQTANQFAAALAAALPSTVVKRVVLGAIVFNPEKLSSVVISKLGYYQRYLGTIERRVQVTTWSYDQTARDALFELIQDYVMSNRFLNVAVPSVGAIEQVGLLYSASTWSDKAQNAGGYMRNLIVTVSFPITRYVSAPVILFTQATVNGIDLTGPVLADDPAASSILLNGSEVVLNGVGLRYTIDPITGVLLLNGVPIALRNAPVVFTPSALAGV